MLNRIPVRLSMSIGALLALILATAIATGVYLSAYRRDTRGVELTLHQAARASALGREAAVLDSVSDAQASDRLASITRLRQAFEATHHALLDGGSAPIDDQSDAESSGPPIAREAVRERLAVVSTQWARTTHALDQLVSSGAKDAEARRVAVAATRELASNLDATATTLKAHADAEVARLFWIQTATTGAGVLLVIFILWGTRRDIGLPLRRMVRDAERMGGGDLATPVDTSGLAEIADLAKALERLRAELSAQKAPEA
jgi:nitrate/nitrite-specific signal transduction histidine kinase